MLATAAPPTSMPASNVDWMPKSPPAASHAACGYDHRGAEQPETSIPAGEWTTSSDQKLARRYTPIDKGLRR